MSVNEVPPGGAPVVADMSSLARIPAVLWSPARAFGAIVARPTVLVVLLLLLVLRAAWMVALYVPVMEPFQKTQMAERMSDMSPAQREAAERQLQAMENPKARIIGEVAGTVMVTVMYVVQLLCWAAVCYFVLTLLMSGRADFKAVFSVTTYAAVVDVVHTLAALPMTIMKQDPRVYFGPAAMMDAPTPPTFLYLLAANLDLFSLWAWGLAAVGLSILYRKKLGAVLVGLGITFVVTSVLMALIQAGMAKMFGGMG
jgi:hypothetical protein